MKFRWCLNENFDGRILRLFRRGHMEELTIVQDLQDAGFKVSNYGDNQTKVDFGTHLSSEIDGIIEIEGEVLALECKTHSDKSFQKLKKEGVFKSKFMHWVQCNVYMYGLGCTKALYYAINKNNDEIYTEIIELDPELAERYIERGQRLATQDELPLPISDNPSWYECKFCNMYTFCHGKGEMINKSCRTCAYSTACEDGTWYCEKHLGELDETTQLHGCDSYELHDHLIQDT